MINDKQSPLGGDFFFIFRDLKVSVTETRTPHFQNYTLVYT